MSTRLATWVLATSDRLYRMLLIVYPPAFRRTYGPHMAQVFRDCCRDMLRRQGTLGLLRLWAHTIGDLTATAVRERMAEPHTPKTARVPVVEGSPALFWSNSQPFDTFTKRARRTLQHATEEAHALDQPGVGTDHMLLGLIREKGGLAAHALDNLGITLEQARRAVTAAAQRNEPSSQHAGLTAGAHTAITHAVDEAKRLNHRYIGTEHLLLGLVRVDEEAGTGALVLLGVAPEQVRDEVLRILSQNGYA